MAENKILDITILCKVVDNYGDIGFVYRLVRSLSSSKIQNLFPSISIKLRLVVDNLNSFSKMAPEVLCNVPEQNVNGWTILDWNDEKNCNELYKKNPPDIILECFQCGRPLWLDNILFDKSNSKVFHIFNIEYLTAEKWADDFHLLKSGTRSAFVKKKNFMPGFSSKTGGLVLDEPFINYVYEKYSNEENDVSKKIKCPSTSAMTALEKYLSAKDISFLTDENIFNVVVFNYPRDFISVVSALDLFQKEKQKKNSNFKVHVFCASGISYEPFVNSWLEANKPFELSRLPFLPQTVWDALLCMSDFNFIRGEDSLSRASLCGVPFVWHAYIQKDEYQIVKVQALLDAMRNFFLPENFSLLQKYVLLYNRNEKNEYGPDCANIMNEVFSKENYSDQDGNEQKSLLEKLLLNYEEIYKSFENFSKSIESNGNMTSSLISTLISIK